MYQKTFTFCQKQNETQLDAKDFYSEETGCGFLPFSAVPADADRFTATAGWNPSEELCKKGESALPEISANEYGVEVREPGFPLRFRVKVPDKGVYRVTLTVHGGQSGIKNMNIYVGRRNLVFRDQTIEPESEQTFVFHTHVCEYQPVVGEPMRLDSSVYVAVLGSPARITEITVEQAQAPTVFIAGDSLVADYDTAYPYNPLISYASWGQNLPQYFSGLAFCNQAHGGMTTNCFRQDGHWEIVSRNIRPGDVFLMEFGHNDQKRRNLKAYVQYAANLRWYIEEVRRKGAYPIIVTSMSRIPGKDEYGWFDLLEEYAQSCLRVGSECHVPVLDLHDYSFRVFCGMGVDICKDYYMDTTHTNIYGALLTSRFLADEIVKQKIPVLSGCRNDFDAQPWKPDLSLRPGNAITSEQKEEAPILPHDLPRLPYADCQGIPQEQKLKEAMQRGLLDPCIRFYHPFEEMPRAQFLYLFFKAVKAEPHRTWQGIYCDLYRYEFDAQSVQTAFDMGLIDETTTPDRRFRPDDALTGGELVSMLIRSLHKPGHRDICMTECEAQARLLGLIWEGYGRNEKVNRADCTVALVKLMNITQAEKESLPCS